LRARGLRNADANWYDWIMVRLGRQTPGRSDPYARITYWLFLPTKQGIIEEMTQKTRTIYDTVDPVWDQEFQLVYTWDLDDLTALEASTPQKYSSEQIC